MIASGVAKKVALKKESTWGVLPGATGARYLRRVTSDVDLSKDTYTSAEIVGTYQISDFRHGLRKIGGSVKGELSPGSYWDVMQSAMRATAAAVTDISAASITLASAAPVNGYPVWTLTRAAGNWYTDGVRLGTVMRITSGLVNVANAAKNIMVIGMTSATVLVVVPMNGIALANEGPTASVVNIPGKKAFVPSTGHTNDSYTFEHFFSDLVQSEQFVGCRIASLAIGLPPTGMSTIDVGVMGKDMLTASAAYFTTPSPAATKGVVAAVNGVVGFDGRPQGILTGLTINLDGGMSTGAVVGSNVTPDVFVGRVNVTGQFTAYFDGPSARDAFLNESITSIVAGFAVDNSNNADFISFALPRVKLGGAAKSDGEQGLVLTCPFQALYNIDGVATNGRENTTIWIQDSNDAMA